MQGQVALGRCEGACTPPVWYEKPWMLPLPVPAGYLGPCQHGMQPLPA